MLNRADEYYENNKEVLRQKAKNKYRELSEKEKNCLKKIHIVIKMHFKIAITKIFFISASSDCINTRLCFNNNKNLMYRPILAMH